MVSHLDAVFYSEPDERGWAAQMETHITKEFGSDDWKGNALADVRCRLSLCRMGVAHEDLDTGYTFVARAGRWQPQHGNRRRSTVPGHVCGRRVMSRAVDVSVPINNFALLCAPNSDITPHWFNEALYIVSGGFFDHDSETWHKPYLQDNANYKFVPLRSRTVVCPTQ
jgi:hypothetical protein